MAFLQRKIDLTFRLSKGSFNEGNFDTVTVSGLRVQVSIQNPSPPTMGQATVRVHGLTPSLMNQLSSVNRDVNGRLAISLNQLIIQAGDNQSGMATVFTGQINVSQPDYNNAPDSSLVIAAQAGYYEALKPASPLSYPTQADVATIMETLATQNGYTFENNGVSVILSTPYLWGSPRQQMEMVARAADINWAIDNTVLAIWPKGSARNGMGPLISPATGMIGYPSFLDKGYGFRVRTLFNPNLRLGANCKLQSSLTAANGTFQIFNPCCELESETPHGKWESSFDAIAIPNGS